MVKLKIGARVFDTLGEEDPERWLLLADYGDKKRQPFVQGQNPTCNIVVRVEPSMDQIKKTIREEYEQKMEELDREFALKAEELKKKFDLQRKMILEAHYLEQDEESFKKKNKHEKLNESFSEVEQIDRVCSIKDRVLSAQHTQTSLAGDTRMCSIPNGLRQRLQERYSVLSGYLGLCNVQGHATEIEDFKIFHEQVNAPFHDLSNKQMAKAKSWNYNRKRVRKKGSKLIVPSGSRKRTTFSDGNLQILQLDKVSRFAVFYITGKSGSEIPPDVTGWGVGTAGLHATRG